MTFLPIVDRELRVASRKAWTFWVRVMAAGVAVFIATGFLLIAVIEATSAAHLGGWLFGILTWLSLFGALSVGLFFTSDCLSEEKREGTLGFLFLTDLRGYDVVLGKLIATSLRCVFGLLAIFPIIAITQLMGGVEASAFWQTLLALLHSVFFSLATGMFVSSISRRTQKAMSGTLFLILFFVVAGPMIDGLIGTLSGTFEPRLSLVSPGYVFVSASRGGLFWESFWPSQLAAWAMLAASCILIRRTWQEKSSRTSATMMRWRYWWKYGGQKQRTAYRRKVLGISPIVWLASRERWQQVPAWIVCGVAAIGCVGLFFVSTDPTIWLIWAWVDGVLAMLFYLWVASQASQFFVEARRSGVIELLLSTPLTSHELIHGPWRALLRTFGLPVGICLAFGVFGPLVALFLEWGPNATLAWEELFGEDTTKVSLWLSQAGRGFASAITIIANLIAISWFGMWMGLTSKNATWATFKTLLFVQVLPWMVIWFGATVLSTMLILPLIAASSSGGGAIWIWFPIAKEVVAMSLAVAKDVLFILLVRKKLRTEFRDMAVRAVSPVRIVTAPVPPLIASPIPAPPVMSKP